MVEARAGRPAVEPVAVSHSWPLSSTGAGVQVHTVVHLKAAQLMAVSYVLEE